MARVWLPMLAASALIGVPSSAVALHLSSRLAERLTEADCIALGTVIEQTPLETRVKGIRFIYTAVRLQVERYLKRPVQTPVAQELLIHVPGGHLGTQAMTASEEASFQVGERVLVLLRQTSGPAYQLVSGSHGKFTLLHDPDNGLEVVRDANGQPLAEDDRAALHLIHLDAHALALSAVLKELETLLHEQTTDQTP